MVYRRDRQAADDRNFYKVEKWSKDDQRIERMLFAGNSLDSAREILQAKCRRRLRGRYTIRQRMRVLDEWPRTKRSSDTEPWGADLTTAATATKFDPVEDW